MAEPLDMKVLEQFEKIAQRVARVEEALVKITKHLGIPESKWDPEIKEDPKTPPGDTTYA